MNLESDYVSFNAAGDDESSWSAGPREAKVVDRWGGNRAVLYKGFIPVPRAFLEWAASLKPKPLSPAEVLFIIMLVGVRWREKPPRLSYDTIGERTGLSEEYCRKLARKLERRGLIHRTRRQGDANHFDLTELF